MFDRKEMALQLREAARELELPGDYSAAAFVRVQGVYNQLDSNLGRERRAYTAPTVRDATPEEAESLRRLCTENPKGS